MTTTLVLRALHESPLDGPAKDLVYAEFCRSRDHFGVLVGEAVASVSLPEVEAHARVLAAALTYTSIQLADDLADGDIAELRRPQAVTVQFTLAQLRLSALARAGLSGSSLAAIARCLQQTADAQHLELRLDQPDLDANKRLALGFGAAQYEAYLRLCWADTAREAEAAPLALGLGVGLHLEHELRSRDPRVFGMAVSDRAELLSWGRALVAQTDACGLASAAQVLAQSAATLERTIS